MLYTGKGDKGTTKLFDTPAGVRMPKTDVVFDALGTLDELNSAIGYAKTIIGKNNPKSTDTLEDVQENLFTIQASLAGADKKITGAHVKSLEERIAEIERTLPPINSFIISGGTPAGGFLDFCRTISRRCEREILKLPTAQKDKLSSDALTYLNRLSSLLYAEARNLNNQSGLIEKGPSY